MEICTCWYCVFLTGTSGMACSSDLDQIYDDLKPENSEKLEKRPADLDLPGLGQFYCILCARYFQNMEAMTTHRKSKPHKNRYAPFSPDCRPSLITRLLDTACAP
jgi:hypothetical protein